MLGIHGALHLEKDPVDLDALVEDEGRQQVENVLMGEQFCDQRRQAIEGKHGFLQQENKLLELGEALVDDAEEEGQRDLVQGVAVETKLVSFDEDLLEGVY